MTTPQAILTTLSAVSVIAAAWSVFIYVAERITKAREAAWWRDRDANFPASSPVQCHDVSTGQLTPGVVPGKTPPNAHPSNNPNFARPDSGGFISQRLLGRAVKRI